MVSWPVVYKWLPLVTKIFHSPTNLLAHGCPSQGHILREYAVTGTVMEKSQLRWHYKGSNTFTNTPWETSNFSRHIPARKYLKIIGLSHSGQSGLFLQQGHCIHSLNSVTTPFMEVLSLTGSWNPLAAGQGSDGHGGFSGPTRIFSRKSSSCGRIWTNRILPSFLFKWATDRIFAFYSGHDASNTKC